MTRNSRRDPESGISVLLLALLLPVLMFALAISIDLALVTISQQQQRSDNRLRALAAIETYFDEVGQNTSPQENLARTLSRVNLLSRENQTVGGFNASPESIVLYDDNSGREEGVLTPGNYFSHRVPKDYCLGDATCLATCQDGKECNPCGDARASAPNPPCFYPLRREEIIRADDPRTPSAFRVETKMNGDVFTRFASSVFGKTSFHISSSAIATIVPRHIMFAVDVSGSTTRENYKDRKIQDQQDTPLEGRGASYAFYLSRDNHSGMCSAAGEEPSDYDWNWRLLEDFDMHTKTYSNASPSCSEPSLPSGTRRDQYPQLNMLTHFYDDYVKTTVLSTKQECEDTTEFDCRPELHPDPPDAGACAANPYLEYCSPPETYRVNQVDTPQPLGNILEGLAIAAEELQKRLVAGDKVGVYLFDRRPVWNRIIKPTNQFDYVKNAAKDPVFQRRMKFFPGNDGNTDIRWALAESVAQLKEAQDQNGVQSQDSIVLISDGLTNCASCGDVPISKLAYYDVDNNSSIDGNDEHLCKVCAPDMDSRCNNHCWTDTESIDILKLTNCKFGCEDSFEYFDWATLDAQEFAQKLTASGANIPIHVIPVGRQVAPHWVDVRAPGNWEKEHHCLSDREVRAAGGEVVRGGAATQPDGCPNVDFCGEAFDARAPENPFYEAVYRLYWLASQTGGVYAPLFQEQASFCSEPDHPDCVANPNTPECCRSQYSKYNDKWDTYYWTEDKYCRTPEQQMREYIRQIITEQSPYIIVEAN